MTHIAKNPEVLEGRQKFQRGAHERGGLVRGEATLVFLVDFGGNCVLNLRGSAQ